MTIDDKIRDERIKYNINREAKKTKKQKRPYHHVKLIYMIVLQVKKYHPHM